MSPVAEYGQQTHRAKSSETDFGLESVEAVLARTMQCDIHSMTANEAAVRNAYLVAENKDVPGWVNCFTNDGTFTDESIGVTYRGARELGRTVEIYATAFPDMHRELFRVYAVDDMVVVELALQGTHNGPLVLPLGTVPPTGKRMDAPCCDVFRLEAGKIQSFNCYPSGTVILTQLGVLKKF